MEFPQEILDVIVNEFDPETDFQSLKSCSSTSWSLLLPARRLIFRHTRLIQGKDEREGNVKNYDKDQVKLASLIQLIEQDPARSLAREGYPTLASYIRLLDLQLASTHTYRANSASQVNDSQRRWNEINISLPSLLGMLQNVERVNLHFNNSWQCDWQLIDTFITNSLLRFLSSPSLTTVSFAAIHGLPIVALLHCPNLQNVYFRNVAGQNEHSVFSDRSITLSDLKYPDPALRLEWALETTYPPPALKACSLTNSSSALEAIINLPDRQRALLLKDLQELRQESTSPLSIKQQVMLFNLVSHTLGILELRSGMNFPPANAVDQFDLGRFRNLHTLDIDFNQVIVLGSTPSPDTHILTYLAHIFKNSTSPTTIREIVIELTWEYLTEPLEGWILAQAAWIKLDEVLAGELYPNLQEVVIKLNFKYDDGDDDFSTALLMEATRRVNGRLGGMFPELRSHRAGQIELKVGAKFETSYSM